MSNSDSVVQILNTCIRARESQQTKEGLLNKLVDRINLDRPILQSEKINLILYEHGQEAKGELTVRQIKNALV